MSFTGKRQAFRIMRSVGWLAALLGFYTTAKRKRRVLHNTDLDRSPHQYLNKGSKFILRSCSQPVKMHQPERAKVFVYDIEY